MKYSEFVEKFLIDWRGESYMIIPLDQEIDRTVRGSELLQIAKDLEFWLKEWMILDSLELDMSTYQVLDFLLIQLA